MQKADEVPDGGMADEILDGSSADSRRGSGGFWYRWLTRFRRVPVQRADEVPEGSGPD